MSSRIITVKILRDQPTGQTGGKRSTGRTQNATGSYGDNPSGPQPIPGSPAGGWPCRWARRKVAYTDALRDSSETGDDLIDNQHILEIRDPSAKVEHNDIAVLPPGTIYADRECRALILRPRFYDRGVQCDLETGAVK